MENLAALNEKLSVLTHQTRAALDERRFQDAKKLILNVLELIPNHVNALNDLAFVESHLRNFDAAFAAAQQALVYASDDMQSNIYDHLAAITYKMNRFEESLHYGRLAIQSKINETAHCHAYPLPQSTAPGLSSDRSKNIISYSLFGSLPRYCETAVLNVKLAQEIYPEWTCRFYVDNSVPENIKTRLKDGGAQVIEVNDEYQKNAGLFWRFRVLSDPNVQCFIIRDADSVLSYKERAAVDEWLNSGKWFHTMRDSNEHTELILAGMWGGYGGVFPDMEPIISEHYERLQLINRTIDQFFLRHLVWPTVAQSVLTHDSRHLTPDSLPYPTYTISEIEKVPFFHIGMIDAHATQTINSFDDLNAKRVRWYLADEHKQIICQYDTDIKTPGKLILHLPYLYSQKIREGKWQIYIQPL